MLPVPILVMEAEAPLKKPRTPVCLYADWNAWSIPENEKSFNRILYFNNEESNIYKLKILEKTQDKFVHQ